MSVPAGALAGPPPGPPQLPPAGLGPMPQGDPVSTLGAAAAGLQQQSDQVNAAATTALMALAQVLGNQASPEAVAAQTSPGQGVPNTMGMPGS